MEVILMIIFLFSIAVHGQSDERNIVNVPTYYSTTTSATAELTSAEIKDKHINLLYLNQSGLDKVSTVLRLIESQRKNCSPGTELNLTGVVDQYGVKKFSGEAQIALNRANLLTRLWKYSPDIFYTTDPLLRNQTEYLLYAAVRTMVELNENIYSAGNCYDWYRYPGYDIFCPFALRMPNSLEIVTKDLAQSYVYEASDKNEWFEKPKEKGIEAIRRSMISNNNTRRGENYFFKHNLTEEIVLVTYEDGHWSKPYYDCGGGNIWMMTYTVPFFGFNWTTQQYHFMGTSGIDIDLRRVDIDQCPTKAGVTEPNVFAGSAKCKTTTQCEPISGLGFSRGSYKCQCVQGFYFPDRSAYIDGRNYFNGTIIEQEYEKYQQGLNNSYEDGFLCLPCPEGCTEGCKDATPCIASLNWTLRTAILVAVIIVMACLPVLFYFTFRYAEVKVIKAASPVLLRLVLLGALLLYGPIVVLFPVPTLVLCNTRTWLRGIGFSVSYGALLLKTWRISVVFRVRSAQRVKITDNNLVKRLCAIVAAFGAFLTIRTVLSPPIVRTVKTENNLKAYLCTTDYWDYCQAGGELLLLLWGIKLCFVVRKAPSEFNESKFISWAIYNEFLLSLFLNISMLFLQKNADPDLLYIIFFAHSQLTTTVVLVLLFGSKAYMVYKGLGKGPEQPTGVNIEQTRSSGKFITKKTQRSTLPLTSSSVSQATTLNTDSYKGQLPGHLTPQEIQDEFKRLYLQLELLKSKNMRLGNPHLTKKLCAMTEAAMAADPSSLVSFATTMNPGTITPAMPSSPSNGTDDLVTASAEATGDTDTNNEHSVEDRLLPPAVNAVTTPTTPLVTITKIMVNSHNAVPHSYLPSNQTSPANSPSNPSAKLPETPLLTPNCTSQPVENHAPIKAFDLRNSKKVFEITI
ncbi:probable G-protein coupled receptor 158 [Paramacrobiotus metropolitanus]|uniref:probable G-protein coupled receptor 158 n=1 Tax=Paramacrobiotus metropolitanus TaxID=2943436 RepID=UPI0024460324|nr:probable G-protein coupled receptor 158 [Paramacrobiotus metropolitanus]